MNSKNWGGKREGAGSGGSRPNAGRPRRRFDFGKLGSSFVVQSETIGSEPTPPEVWELANVTADYFEFQIGRGNTTEILTIAKIDFWNGE